MQDSFFSNPNKNYLLDTKQTYKAIKFDKILGAWIVTGFTESQQILNDSDSFSTQSYLEFQPDISRIHMFLLASKEDHSRLRKILKQCFSPQRLELLKNQVLIPTADKLASDLPLGIKFDIIHKYIEPYFKKSIYSIIGVNSLEGDELVATLKVAYKYFEKEDKYSHRGQASLQILYELARNICKYSKHNQNVGLIQFIHNQKLIREISFDEMVCFILSFFETLAFKVQRDLPATLIKLIGISETSLQQKLQDNSKLLFDAADEAVRLQNGSFVPRIATKDTKIGETTILQGSKVFILLGKANKDEQIFQHPYQFDPCRKNVTQHLGFGTGLHICPAKNLAKLIAVTSVQALLKKSYLINLIGAKEKKIDVILNHIY